MTKVNAFCGRRSQRWSAILISSGHRTYIQSASLSIVDVDLDHLSEVVVVSFSIVRLLFSSPFPDKGYSLEGGNHIPRALTEWGVKILFLEGTELTGITGNFSAQICPLPPIYGFNHLFTSVWTQIFLLYFRLESNTTLCILWRKLFQLWPLGALSQLAPLFLKLIPITVWVLGFSYEFCFALSSISLLNRHYKMLLVHLVYFLFQP